MMIETASLTGTILESLLYWVYVLSSAVSIYCLYNVRGKTIAPNKIVIGVSTALFVIITVFYGISVFKTVSAFTGRDANSAYRVRILARLDAVQTVRLTAYSLVMVLMDALLAYRLYIVFLRNIYVVILPIVSTTFLLAISIFQAIVYTEARSWGPEAMNRFTKWAAAGMILSVVACTYSTSLIVFRIVRDGRAFRRFGTRNIFGPVLFVVVESALVYSALIITMLVLYLTNSVAIGLFIHVVPPLIGLNYSIVLIRISLGLPDVGQSDIGLPTITVTLPSHTHALDDNTPRSLTRTSSKVFEERKLRSNEERERRHWPGEERIKYDGATGMA